MNNNRLENLRWDVYEDQKRMKEVYYKKQIFVE